MQSAVPKPDTTRLDDVLVVLSEINNGGELETFLRQLNLRDFEPELSEVDRAQLLDAVAAATARCWAARTYCRSGEC
jgi:hypothetical protein